MEIARVVCEEMCMRREFFSIWDLNGDYITAVAMQVVSGLSVRVGNAVRKANRTVVTRDL